MDDYERNLLEDPQQDLGGFLTVGSDDESSVSGSFMPSDAVTPIIPARLDMSSPSTGRPSMFNIGKNICKHDRQPSFCLECFDEYNYGRKPRERFGRICQHRKFMSAICPQCERRPKEKKGAATVVPVASSAVASSDVASSAIASSDRPYNPILSDSRYSHAGPESNQFGTVSPFAHGFDGHDDYILPPEMDDRGGMHGGSKSYRKSARKLIKKAKRSSKKAKRSSRKAKKSSRKAKRSSRKTKRS